jgi:hypothetical protein
MQISLRIFWLPKRGNTAEEYEDAYWPTEPVDFASECFRFAVADGATETSFAGAWAKVLARAYCRDQLSEKKIRRLLPRLEKEWQVSIGNGSLPWYAEQKLSQGAFATLLGLTLSNGGWSSTAIGDSCLFQVRGRHTIASFPLTRSDEFNNRPTLMSSNRENWGEELARVVRTQGLWEPADIFYLMTDAIACWFLRAHEKGEEPSAVLEGLEGGEAFGEWVGSLRDARSIRNDDVTVLRVRCTGAL